MNADKKSLDDQNSQIFVVISLRKALTYERRRYKKYIRERLGTN